MGGQQQGGVAMRGPQQVMYQVKPHPPLAFPRLPPRTSALNPTFLPMAFVLFRVTLPLLPSLHPNFFSLFLNEQGAPYDPALGGPPPVGPNGEAVVYHAGPPPQGLMAAQGQARGPPGEKTAALFEGRAKGAELEQRRGSGFGSRVEG